MNSGRYGIVLDSSKPNGREVARRLALRADVLMNHKVDGEAI
jgi:crotonobetainyl-CoA:carnitine CoA-transferase CaiB-like acyl-CoA transferase